MGAEVECSLLFADVRESTKLAETMRPAEYRRLMDRFYATAFDALVARDAFVDKFVGDEVIGIFLPAMTDGPHAREAVEAGVQLLRDTANLEAAHPIPIGIGINSGIAYVGAVGTEEHVEFTALGDIVNVAARLSAVAGAGELLVTDASMGAAGLSDDGLEHRRLELKGKSEMTDVAVLSTDVALSPLPAVPAGT